MAEKIRSYFIGNDEETHARGILPSLPDNSGSCVECTKGKLTKTKRK